MCEKQCLRVGLICMILYITFKRDTTICKKQCLQVGLTRMILDVAFKRGVDVCMHYRIFVMDGGFEPACVILTCFALQFHRFTGGF